MKKIFLVCLPLFLAGCPDCFSERTKTATIENPDSEVLILDVCKDLKAGTELKHVEIKATEASADLVVVKDKTMNRCTSFDGKPSEKKDENVKALVYLSAESAKNYRLCRKINSDTPSQAVVKIDKSCPASYQEEGQTCKIKEKE